MNWVLLILSVKYLVIVNIKDFCVIGFISSLGFRSFDSTGYKPTFDYGFYNANG